MLSCLVDFNNKVLNSQMKGTTVSARYVSLTSREISPFMCSKNAVSFLCVGFPTLRSCFQAFTGNPLPANLSYLPNTGISCWNTTSISLTRDAAFSHTILYLTDTFSPTFLHLLPFCSCLLSKTHFVHKPDGSAWPTNRQAGEELCLCS